MDTYRRAGVTRTPQVAGRVPTVAGGDEGLPSSPGNEATDSGIGGGRGVGHQCGALVLRSRDGTTIGQGRA